MIVALAGASGFIGHVLKRKIRELGWDARIIDRASFSITAEQFTENFIEGADVVINLAGAPIAKKWTPEYKLEIMESRVNTTRMLSAAIGLAGKKPGVFISSSAIGIYDSVNTHDESSSLFAENFLAEVCHAWESEAMKVRNSTRLVIIRTGVVLGRDGGALEKMDKPFSIGLGGKIGNGKQFVSFIHIEDLVNAMVFIIENPSVSGVVNAVSPFPTNNEEFTDKLGKVFRQPAWLTVPAFAIKMLYGEGAQVILDGQKVLPKKLMDAGFRFKYPTLQNALVQIYG